LTFPQSTPLTLVPAADPLSFFTLLALPCFPLSFFTLLALARFGSRLMPLVPMLPDLSFPHSVLGEGP
jgi:hypothetical protein